MNELPHADVFEEALSPILLFERTLRLLFVDPELAVALDDVLPQIASLELVVEVEDGPFEARSGSKDIIISGAENISTIEVENIVYQHPDVQEVAIVGIADEKWGEVPKAFITLRPGANTSAEDVINFCRDRLSHFKCPRYVEFGELPKTATGKIQKFKLREYR
jgi:acyl-coenzyme A synthetase/AMP-(fatty) acid ligase